MRSSIIVLFFIFIYDRYRYPISKKSEVSSTVFFLSLSLEEVRGGTVSLHNTSHNNEQHNRRKCMNVFLYRLSCEYEARAIL